MCAPHRATTSSTHPLTHPRRKAGGSSVRIYTYTVAFNKNTRQSRQSVRRCSANILFITADGFSVLPRVVVFFVKPERRIPLRHAQSRIRHDVSRSSVTLIHTRVWCVYRSSVSRGTVIKRWRFSEWQFPRGHSTWSHRSVISSV